MLGEKKEEKQQADKKDLILIIFNKMMKNF
jgi:hypothetical protein